MITEQHQEEALSAAYIAACAAKAGCNMAFAQRDYGVDGSLHPVQIFEQRRLQMGYPVEFQAKATINWDIKNDEVVYDMEVKSYNDIVRRRKDGGNPFILILLCLPQDRTQWLEMGKDFLTLRHCSYWYLIQGEASANETTVRIKIPIAQRFTPETIVSLLQLAKKGELK